MSTASSSIPEPAAAHGAAILGCAGERLSSEERRFFRDADPLGFILFRRNCRTPGQVRALVDELRASVGRDEAPILIDQEGGRVARLVPPQWPALPAAAAAGRAHGRDPEAGREAAWLLGRLAAAMLAPLGISVNCAPVLDVLAPDVRHPIIGDRAFGSDPGTVAELGEAYARGLTAGGVLPVFKHIPGHGRADADSHLELPVVAASAAELARDVAPFRALAPLPMAMTAHVLYPAWDGTRPATLSPAVIAGVVRGEVGFDGLLLTDDLSMQALTGSLGERTAAAIAAGCDIALHCNGRLGEMTEVAGAAGRMTTAAVRRWRAALAQLREPDPFDADEGRRRLTVLTGVPEA